MARHVPGTVLSALAKNAMRPRLAANLVAHRPPFARLLHVSPTCMSADPDHYKRLQISRDASSADIKRAFYKLSKAHHPDVNPSDSSAADTFSRISESYSILSNPSRRAAYDRHLGLDNHPPQSRARNSSYSSTTGGRPASGLSRRRASFRGPPPSFYRSGGWGAHADARRRAHDESTGFAHASPSSSSSSTPPPHGNTNARHAGMGPGCSPFHHADEAGTPHFDFASHTRTHRRQDQWRSQRSRRALDDDSIDFEPQTGLGVHFLIVTGILTTSFLAHAIYLQYMRTTRRSKDRDY
ncbi:hypothetical protein CDD81_7243 [Ophiocordyceps australis]|uniref:J domain-containing protein n=1 Tax=Ophiocordyceps australis TaxID=1399860 RepID=A0A2C5Y3U6_9HYPO|nr:hypothetical protein CDD81_7243 [Ophiocordyceps australis]